MNTILTNTKVLQHAWEPTVSRISTSTSILGSDKSDLTYGNVVCYTF